MFTMSCISHHLHVSLRHSICRMQGILLAVSGEHLVLAPTLMCCGRRILVFLANTMPLEERSGVNLQGSFNTAHSTPVEDVPEVGCP